MKYICCLLLGLAPAVWGMEEATIGGDARRPLGERRIDVNRFAELKVSYATCLNTDAIDGYPLQSTLEIRRNCLKHFVNINTDSIKELRTLGLFKGQITSYNEETMTILSHIFGSDADKENQTSAIPTDFRHHTEDFINDLNDLRTLLKNQGTQSESIQSILKEMYSNFCYVNWMVTYYLDHLTEYRRLHPVR